MTAPPRPRPRFCRLRRQVARALLPELLLVAADSSGSPEDLRAAALSILYDVLKSLGVMAGVYQREVRVCGRGGEGEGFSRSHRSRGSVREPGCGGARAVGERKEW